MKQIIGLLLLFFMLLFSCTFVFAAENPLSAPNNRAGIHILFSSELPKAAALVNSNGGDYGYVVIPIQSGDKDLAKWQSFLDSAKKLHVIPIIRLATEGDYFNTKVWRVPTEADVLDFANFLNSLNWPYKNRYIIVYNEVNRADEWGGKADPTAYAQLLQYAVSTFKTRSTDFFMISAGMDNAATTDGTNFNEYDLYSQMESAVPGIFNQIDGLASHSYPNPGFSSLPSSSSKMSISSFQYEKQLISLYTQKTLPTFITETGWSQDVVGQQQAASNLTIAMQSVWNTDGIVTVAPFLLDAGSGPFTQFSFLDANGNPNAVYTAFANVSKVKGSPAVNPPAQNVLGAQTAYAAALPTKSFTPPVENTFASTFETNFKSFFKFLLNVR